ncbi:hypothetical protein HXX02_17235 [Microbulbifer elongatus]|uniref:Uncharacterized protein n=1 Tax=Microbulbifer elongatus TaxID=86173 RepID=A0ABT1P4Y3_9GAMM|nr:hypothetical protein [Microbulbifer elongatus]MCQ3831178.1 hypothetical protein [Microbulbifer elongatus]
MNYILLIVVSITCLAVGWFLGSTRASSEIDQLEKAQDYLEESSDFLKIEKFQAAQARDQIRLIKYLEKGNHRAIEEDVVYGLGSFYKMSKESIEDGMASEEDIEIVSEVLDLAKSSVLFKKVTEHQE